MSSIALAVSSSRHLSAKMLLLRSRQKIPFLCKIGIRSLSTAVHYIPRSPAPPYQSTKRPIVSNRRHEDAMRHVLQRHGYQLANVNPIRTDGLLTNPSCVKRCIPPSMGTLLDILTEMRSSQDNHNNFAASLRERLLQSNHISIHEEDAASLEKLVRFYCNHIGFEFEHCNTEAERKFFVSVIENPDQVLSEAGLERFDDTWIYEQLYRTELFERLLRERYSNARTFGVEGMESATLAINTLVETFARATDSENTRILLGTTHRGRINFLANCLKLPWSNLISCWDETNSPTYDDICDPYSQLLTFPSKQKNSPSCTSFSCSCHLSMPPIPAHLEAMVSGIMGKARAHVSELNNGNESPGSGTPSWESNTILPISLHGDSSFCGEGIIQETLQLSTCKHYECGGTIHMIVNNQVGFTTELASIKSDRFLPTQSSDIVKSIGAPVLHVNANKPRDVVRACQIALLYRQTFGADILIDLVGWRKRGHNELDDPTMTNVNMYHALNQLESVVTTFRREIETRNGTDWKQAKEEVNRMYHEAKEVKRDVSQQHEHHPIGKGMENGVPNDPWSNIQERSTNTGISQELLRQASAPLMSVPDGFTLHPLVEKAVKARQALLQSGEGRLDWATAELLALSSLANQGIRVRLSGEDSERGTFAQRHAVWHDAITGKEHAAIPSNMEVANSPLSEFSIVGFEFGWSLCHPDSLALWEAQFGDFSNEAQVIFDTIVSSSASKWNVESNMVLLLPHGADGMGPEHSCCRPERWLQMFATENLSHDEDPTAVHEASNFIVACPTEPANYFHLLRRQLAWPFRRPLIVMTPKRTLRSASATSALSDIMIGGTKDHFSCVLDDPYWKHAKNEVQSLLLCCGELYYDLAKLRQKGEGLSNVALIRMEQLAPFPSRELNSVVGEYPNLRKVAWAQEEPANDGALSFIRDQLLYKKSVPNLVDVPIQWLSRPEAAAPAEGHPSKYSRSQQQLLRSIIDWCGNSKGEKPC